MGDRLRTAEEQNFRAGIGTYRLARGAAPSASGLSPEAAIRRGRGEDGRSVLQMLINIEAKMDALIEALRVRGSL